jgi:type II secretory pathway pseudopilin PulG
MKRKTVILIICLIASISILAFFVLCGVETSVRHSAVRNALSHLPVLIEAYRENKGAYPNSLDELIAVESNPESKNLIQLILHDQWNDHYEYSVRTNGFNLKADMPSGLFVKKDESERCYKIGEALKSSEGN